MERCKTIAPRHGHIIESYFEMLTKLSQGLLNVQKQALRTPLSRN